MLTNAQSYRKLDAEVRCRILHALLERQFSDLEGKLGEEVRSLDADTLRLMPFGYDGELSAYWYVKKHKHCVFSRDSVSMKLSPSILPLQKICWLAHPIDSIPQKVEIVLFLGQHDLALSITLKLCFFDF